MSLSLKWLRAPACLMIAVLGMAAASHALDISPVLERVIDNCNGTYTAYFGYNNPNGYVVDIPVGPENILWGMQAQNQTTRFDPGRHYDQFTVVFDGSNVVWSLEGHTATASGRAATNSCSTQPVSPVLESVTDNCNGSFTAYFGYDNPNAFTVTIPVGDNNVLVGRQEQPQPSSFLQGRHTNVFSVVFDGSDLVWSLNSHTATASGSEAANSCEPPRVSPVLEEVVDNCNGTYTAWFGYSNPGASTVNIPVGADNRFSTTDNLGQPTSFLPGRQVRVFSVNFNGSDLVWTLQAHTATANGGAATNQCGTVAINPVLERVASNCDGTYTAWFGYNNDNSMSVSLDIGPLNYFTGRQDQGQPTTFLPGRHADVFSVLFDGSNLVWTLNGHTSTASGSAAPPCDTSLAPIHPVMEQVIDNCDNTYTAVYGYLNENAVAKDVPVGTDNNLVGRPVQNQVTHFLPGRVNDAFRVVFDGSDLVWHLLGRTATANASAAQGQCPCIDPAIQLQPASATVPAGGTIRFTASATGSRITYQWKRNDQDIPGATDSQYVLSAVKTINNGDQFRVKVTNHCGTYLLSSVAVLTVGGSLNCAILSPPAGDTVEAGFPFVTQVGVDCPGATFRWLKDTMLIPGAVAEILITEPVTMADSGAAFRCIVDNGTVVDTSAPAVLIVTRPRDGRRLVAVSGTLHRPDGNLVGDSVAAVDFAAKIYNRRTGGVPLYTEVFAGTRRVVVRKGEFTIQLGRGRADTDLTKVITGRANLFVELHAGTASKLELVGARLPLTSVPYAISSGVQVIYGEGSPPGNSTPVALGTMYVDRSDGNRTWKKTKAGWARVD